MSHSGECDQNFCRKKNVGLDGVTSRHKCGREIKTKNEEKNKKKDRVTFLRNLGRKKFREFCSNIGLIMRPKFNL